MKQTDVLVTLCIYAFLRVITFIHHPSYTNHLYPFVLAKDIVKQNLPDSFFLHTDASTGKLANAILGVLGGVVRDLAPEAAKDDEDGEEDCSEDDELPESGVVDTVFGPSAATSTSVFLELVCTKLVVDETAKSDGVAKELEGRDGVPEDDHGGDDEEDIFEHS